MVYVIDRVNCIKVFHIPEDIIMRTPENEGYKNKEQDRKNDLRFKLLKGL
jgi:hypothetical protein